MASLQHRFAGGSRGLAATDGSGMIAVPDRLDQNAGCRLAARRQVRPRSSHQEKLCRCEAGRLPSDSRSPF